MFKNVEKEKTTDSDGKNASEASLKEMKNYIYSFLSENNKAYIESKEKGDTKDVFASEIIHLINSNNFYLILCAILFNFINIYKVFILAMTVFSANFISSTLSYIFHSPKPYMSYYKKIKSGALLLI